MIRSPARGSAPTDAGTVRHEASALRPSRGVVWLAVLIGGLALVAAGAGLFWPGGDGESTFTTLRGETVELYGRGLYRHDTLFRVGAFRGADAVTLVLGIPLLVFTTLPYRCGSLRGGLLLLGTLGWFLYTYASVALGTAYNDLFLLYIALFAASLFAFVLTFISIDRHELARHLSPHVPRRGVAAFMIASGVVTMVVWLGPLLGALVQGEAPELLDSYTTTVTDVLDLGIIAPAVFLSGILILRGAPRGYVIAFSLLVLEALLAPMMAAQTVFQVEAGVSISAADFVPPLVGFGVLALGAIWVLVVLLRSITGSGNGAAGGG
jgi:hypothetical protein